MPVMYMETPTNIPTKPTNSDLASEIKLQHTLIEIIDATQDAPPQLDKMLEHQAQLQAEIKRAESTAEQLQVKVQKEYKDWNDMHSRLTTRLVAKLRSPKMSMSEQEEKEERDYLDAVEKEHAARITVEELRGQVTELAEAIDSVRPQAEKHAQATERLRELYARVFDGPTPGYPEEDEMERKYQAALKTHQAAAAESVSCQHTLNLLHQATRRLNEADEHARDAVGQDKLNLVSRNKSVSKSQHSANAAMCLIEQAGLESPTLMEQFRTQNPNTSTPFLDAYASPHGLAPSLKTIFDSKPSRSPMQKHLDTLALLVDTAEQRYKSAQAATRASRTDMNKYRDELNAVRRCIMEEWLEDISEASAEQGEEKGNGAVEHREVSGGYMVVY